MDINIWLYTLTSVIIISIVSFTGIFTLSMKEKTLKRIIIYLVSLSAGSFFGDAFIHLLPETVEEFGFGFEISIHILLGIIAFFILEKILHWHHYHFPHNKNQIHPFAIMNLIGDSVHNFIDGLIIGASYLISFPVGIATTLAVILHEIPQEISDFGVLIHGGFSKTKALFFNFLTALTAILGAIVSLLLSSFIENLTMILIPFAAGAFIYIAGSDLIPELHKEVEIRKSLLQFVFFNLGLLLMFLLIFIE